MNGLERRKHKALPLLLAGALVWSTGRAIQPHATADPGGPGPCQVSSQIVSVNGSLETHIYYPKDNQCDAELKAPYPAIAFAHGFSMFGLSNGPAENAGNGEHLASWGYVVAIPRLPDDVEGRIADMQAVFSYLETETDAPASFLYHKVDTDWLAVAGHSFGGATVLALAARDARVKAAVALDPVYHQGGPGSNPEIWDPDVEGPEITAPTCILGAPSSTCNSASDYAEIYPFVGATHKASFLIVGASHCDFMDPGQSFCTLICGGSTDPQRTRLIQKIMTAWFNYYLHLDTDYYTYLYGAEAGADIAGDRIERHVDTAPHGLGAMALAEAVALAWQLYEHPIVAGYNLYRRLPGEAYTETPHARVGRTFTYLDVGLQAGQVYSYTLRSRDPAGNLHQPSGEVSAVPGDATAWAHVYLPVVLRIRP